ncbi:MAG: hypothetical protein ACI9UJ_001630, partial [bacterium]
FTKNRLWETEILVCFDGVLRYALLFFALLMASTTGWSQERPKLAIGFNYYPGFLVAHREDSKNLEAHTHGFELQISKQQSVQPWAKHYSKPEIYMGLLYMNLGNPDLTGNAFAAMPGFETSLKSFKHSEIRIRFSTGLAYLTKKFDIYTNRRNQAIGSHLNGVMQGFATWETRQENNPWHLQVGIGLTHFSNGSYRVPNLGVNMPSLYFGGNYLIEQKPSRNPIIDTLDHKNWQVYATYGFKERSLTKTTGFNIWNVGVTRIKQVSLKRSWRFGTDIYIDKTHHFIDYPDEPLTGLKIPEMTEFGLYVGHQLLISRVYFVTDIGFYPYKPSANKFITYQRLGFYYHFNQHGYILAALKTHFGIADHFTWGFGYRI